MLAVMMIAVLFTTFTPSSASAADKRAWGAATVNCSALNIRKGPGTSYAKLGTIPRGTTVVVISKTANNQWFYINYQGILGYCSASYFTSVLTAENFNAVGTVDCNTSVNIRQKPGTQYAKIGSLKPKTQVQIIGINNGWYKVKTSTVTGYVASEFIDIQKYTSSSGTVSTTLTSASTPTKTGNAIADYALKFLGYKYVYGAESPSVGFDCSGLVWYVFKQFGVTVSRTATTQYKNNGTKVAKADLIPGDLLFFSSNGGKTM